MLIVPEALIADLLTPEDAYAAVEAAFAAMARGEARNFPVVREALAYDQRVLEYDTHGQAADDLRKCALVLAQRLGLPLPGGAR